MNHPQPPALTSRIWWAEFLLSYCFLLVTRLQQSLTCSASTRIQASRMAVPTRLQRMDGGAAMSMRSTNGCGLGGLTIEETSERKDAVSNALHKRAADSEQRSTSSQGGSSLIPSTWYSMIVCTSMYKYIMYECVQGCTNMYQYNQGLQIFKICTYLFFIFDSKIQFAVLRRCISAFINNRK